MTREQIEKAALICAGADGLQPAAEPVHVRHPDRLCAAV